MPWRLFRSETWEYYISLVKGWYIRAVKQTKLVSYIVGLGLGLVVLLSWQWPSQNTRMVVCDVGQGDAILIIKERLQVLVDGGPSTAKVLACLEQHVPFWDRTIELIVLTNTDFDHMNGLSAVLDRYEVIQFVTADGVHESAALDKFIDSLDRNGVRVEAVERGDWLIVGEERRDLQLRFEVIWPPDTKRENVAIFGSQMEENERKQILGASAKASDRNERSVVLLLLEDTKSVLLSGDIGVQTEKELLELGGLRSVDVLKVGHHGSKYASTREFLDIIKPEIAVISAGINNRYGHPTGETLERLSRIGAMIYRTDKDGTVVLEL